MVTLENVGKHPGFRVVSLKNDMLWQFNWSVFCAVLLLLSWPRPQVGKANPLSSAPSGRRPGGSIDDNQTSPDLHKKSVRAGCSCGRLGAFLCSWQTFLYRLYVCNCNFQTGFLTSVVDNILINFSNRSPRTFRFFHFSKLFFLQFLFLFVLRTSLTEKNLWREKFGSSAILRFFQKTIFPGPMHTKTGMSNISIC